MKLAFDNVRKLEKSKEHFEKLGEAFCCLFCWWDEFLYTILQDEPNIFEFYGEHMFIISFRNWLFYLKSISHFLFEFSLLSAFYIFNVYFTVY